MGKDHVLVRRLRTLTFGLLTPFYFIRAGSLVSVPALVGLNHQVIDQTQYSHLVATVIGSAVIPTAIANARFMPRHLLPRAGLTGNLAEAVAGGGEEVK